VLIENDCELVGLRNEKTDVSGWMLSITEKKSIVAGSSSLTQAFDDCHPSRIESRVSVRYNIELQCGKRTWKLTDATAV